jgi:hypothetical protein
MAKANNKNKNKTTDKPMRQVNALTVRSELSRSLTKKYNALPSEKKIRPSIIKIIALITMVIAFTILILKNTH